MVYCIIEILIQILGIVGGLGGGINAKLLWQEKILKKLKVIVFFCIIYKIVQGKVYVVWINILDYSYRGQEIQNRFLEVLE